MRALKDVTAQAAGLLAYLDPVSASFLAWAILGRDLGWQVFVGGLAVVAGGALVVLYENAPSPHRRRLRFRIDPMAAGNGSVPDRNLALELVRVTEAAALGCARWIGRGDKEAADQAAVDAMRAMLDTVTMAGVVVIGEGEKDKAPMLFNGEEVGNGEPPEVDVAVDPLEGTRLTSVGQPNAIAVIAVAERGTMFFPGAAVYMDKIAAGPEIADAIDIDASPQDNVRRAAERKGGKPTDITVVVLDRERNQELIDGLRDVGAKVNLITDGDVAPAIAAARQAPRST